MSILKEYFINWYNAFRYKLGLKNFSKNHNFKIILHVKKFYVQSSL